MQTIKIEGQEVTVVGETNIETDKLVEEIKKEVGKVVLAHIDVGNFRSASTTTLTAAICKLLKEKGLDDVAFSEGSPSSNEYTNSTLEPCKAAEDDYDYYGHPEVKIKPWNAPYKMKGKFK